MHGITKTNDKMNDMKNSKELLFEDENWRLYKFSGAISSFIKEDKITGAKIPLTLTSINFRTNSASFTVK